MLIITKDRADDVGRALDSLLIQTRPLQQVVIVDSGSDDTDARVAAFANTFGG